MTIKFDEILNTYDKGIRQATGPLSILYRKILFDRGIDNRSLNILLTRYVNDPKNLIPNNPVERSSARGNLMKELAKPAITFKSFMKGIKLLNPSKVKFVVELEWYNQTTTVHSITMDMGHMYQEEKNDE